MVGRASEWEDALRLLFTEGTGLVLSGPAGVGKTRFVAELVDHARRAGFSLEAAVATRSATTIPFASFAHLAGAARHAFGRTEMLTCLEDEFARRCGLGPLLVCVDDAHLVDDGTAAVIHAIAGHVDLRLLLTLRSGEDAPDAINGLWQDGTLGRIDLGPLPRPVMEQLMESLLAGPVDVATKHRLQGLSAGNPLFLREIVYAGTSSGSLRLANSVWQWNGQPMVAERLEQVIGNRISEIPDDHRVVLQALAVAEPLPVAVLTGMVGAAGVESLEVSGVIATSVDPEGRLQARLAQPVYGEVIRAQLVHLVKARLMGQLADLIVALPVVTEDDRLRAAVWRADSDAPLDIPLTLLAARRAMALFDFHLSLRLAQKVLQAGPASEALLIAAHSLYWTDRFEECEALLANIDESATDQQKLEATIVRSAACFWGLDDVGPAMQMVVDRLEQLTGPVERLVLEGHLSSFALWSGDPPEAKRLCDRVLNHPSADPDSRIRASVPAALGAALDGRRDVAVQTADSALPEAIDHLQRFPLAAGELLVVQTVAEWLAGDLGSAQVRIRGLIDWSLERGIADLIGVMTLLSGQVANARGDIAAAVPQLREAVAVLRQHDPGRFLAWAWAALATALGQMGDAAGSALASEEAARTQRSATAVFAPLICLGSAWTKAAQGATSLAARQLMDGVDKIRGRQLKTIELILLIDLARVGEPAQARSRLAVLAEEFRWSMVDAAFDFASGLADSNADLLDRAATSFETWGANLLATETALNSARLWRRDGRLGAASAASERARNLLLACPGASTPLLKMADETLVDPLSAREREIATLAANGLTNRAVAERLNLSERTVENHLARAFSKLGVNDRRALAKIFAGVTS